jgi:hypothetical protein
MAKWTHVQHSRPTQAWGPGREPQSVRDAYDAQARNRAQVRDAERKSEAEREAEREAEIS